MSPQKGVEGGGWGVVGWARDRLPKWMRMIIEGTRPQNNLSEAGNRLKSHKTDIHHTFSELLICPECMNPSKHFSVIHRPVKTSDVVIQPAREQSTKSIPDKLKAILIWKLLA